MLSRQPKRQSLYIIRACTGLYAPSLASLTSGPPFGYHRNELWSRGGSVPVSATQHLWVSIATLLNVQTAPDEVEHNINPAVAVKNPRLHDQPICVREKLDSRRCYRVMLGANALSSHFFFFFFFLRNWNLNNHVDWARVKTCLCSVDKLKRQFSIGFKPIQHKIQNRFNTVAFIIFYWFFFF